MSNSLENLNVHGRIKNQQNLRIEKSKVFGFEYLAHLAGYCSYRVAGYALLNFSSLETQLAKLRKQREGLDAKEKALRANANGKVIAEIVALAKKHNLTPSELTAPFGKGRGKGPTQAQAPRSVAKTTDKRAKVVPKYSNPIDRHCLNCGRLSNR